MSLLPRRFDFCFCFVSPLRCFDEECNRKKFEPRLDVAFPVQSEKKNGKDGEAYDECDYHRNALLRYLRFAPDSDAALLIMAASCSACSVFSLIFLAIVSVSLPSFSSRSGIFATAGMRRRRGASLKSQLGQGALSGAWSWPATPMIRMAPVLSI